MVRKLKSVHGVAMLPAVNRHDVVIDAAACKRFPLRGHTVTAHQGLLYVIGGKLKGGKDASSHIHVLSLPHVLNKKPALKASIEVSFRIWDHAACVLAPSAVMPHGCICVIAGRAANKLGFSQQAFLINLDPSRFDVLTVPVRSGCALLPHPHKPNVIIMHGGRTVPGMDCGKAHTTTNGSQTILSDWHALTLNCDTVPTSARSKTLVLESAELRRASNLQQTDLTACKHCLWPVGDKAAGSKGSSFPALVCGGSAALEHRPLSTVDIDINSTCVSLLDSSAGSGSTSSLASAVCCANVPGSQGSHGLFLVPIRKPQPAVLVVAVDGQAGGQRLSVAQQRTLPLPACDTLIPLCVASAAASCAGRSDSVCGQGHGPRKEHGVVVVAQGQTGDQQPALYVWSDPWTGGKVSTPALHPAAMRGQEPHISSYTGDYALPDSDPIRVDDLQVAAKAASDRGGHHAVSAPATTSRKRKSDTTAAMATKRRHISTPAPATDQQAGRARPTWAAGKKATAAPFGTTASEIRAAQQELDLGDHRVIQDTPEGSMYEDLGTSLVWGADEAMMRKPPQQCCSDTLHGAPTAKPGSVMMHHLEVQQLQERAQLTGRLESEVASLQQTLQEHVQNASKAGEHLAALRLELAELKAALEREQACSKEARAFKASALQREEEYQRRLQAAAQQSEEQRTLKAEVAALQSSMRAVEGSRDALHAKSVQLQNDISHAQSAWNRDVADLQSRCGDLSKEKEDCKAQQNKLQEQNDALQEECSKARAAGEQHQQQLEALRKKLDGAGKKLDEEEQRRLQEVKELQEHHEGHVAELENCLRLEKVNRDTTGARHSGEIQKYKGKLLYLEDAAKMCQEASELASKRAEEQVELLKKCKAELEAAEQENMKLQGACAAHEESAKQAQETMSALQEEVGEVRSELSDHKQRLREAQAQRDEHRHTIEDKNVQIVQLQQEKVQLVAFHEQMTRIAQERQNAIDALSSCQASMLAAQKHECEAFSTLAAKQAAVPPSHNPTGN